MPENPTNIPESPSSGEIAHNYADAHLSMNAAINMTAGHDANVLAADLQEQNNSVSEISVLNGAS
uniref:SFRICE_017981 n=1 Tax=Spodoptera frugiperda TaxID=7108 RepID=A0A2H1V2S4_SPOFR